MPNRSRTSVPSANQANTPNTKPTTTRSEALQEARTMGQGYAANWGQLDPTIAQAQPLEAWRAIGYANAVLSFEHSPLLAELMQAWEQGFDGKDDAVTSNAPAVPEQCHPAQSAPNPYFVNPDRAPYELGHLLQQLPADFGVAPAVELKHVQMAAAAEAHAHAAGGAIWSGIEAIGQLVEMAGANEEESVPAHTLFNLGGLLRHLAVEGQYLVSVGDSLAYANALYAQRGTPVSQMEASGQKGGAA